MGKNGNKGLSNGVLKLDILYALRFYYNQIIVK